MSGLLRTGLAGAAAELGAAFAMNCFQIAWGKASEKLCPEPEDGSSDEQSGDPATAKALEKFQGMIAGRPLPKGERQVAGNLLHCGFGAVLGVI